MRHTPAALTAMVATLAVALAGCGGSTTAVEDLPADAVFLTAVDRSTDVSTVRVRYESTTFQGGEVFHSGSGEATFAPGAISLTFTMGDWAGSGRSGDEDGAAESLSYEMRFVDGRMYMRIPELLPGPTEADPPDAEWIVYDDGETDGVAAQMEQLDFGATLQALRDSADVTEDGHETIAGVATTRFVGTTTLRSLMLAQSTPEEELEQQAGGDFGPDLDQQMPLTVWIGDDGLVRRYDCTTTQGELETTQSMTVLEYGLEVDITAPPAEATMSAQEFNAYEEQTMESSSSGFYEELESEFESSEGTVTFESEGSATAEAVPAPRATAHPSPTDQSGTDNDG